MKNTPPSIQETPYLYLYGGAAGETLFGMDLARLLNANVPDAQMVFLSTRENDFARGLLAPIPQVSFLVLPKGKVSSWFTLLRLAFTPHKIVVHEPLSSPMPLWWKIILRATTLRRGSIEVRGTPQPTTHRAPKRARVVGYSPRTDQIFDTIPRILEAWGAPSTVSLPIHLDASLYGPPMMKENPYIVFHFFAPLVQRSMPVAHARELLVMVHNMFPHLTLILTCTRHELDRARRMTEGTSAEIRSDLSPAALISLYVGTDAYIGVDTGMTHLACHLSIPCVVLGNRSNPCWLPYYAPRAVVLFEPGRCGCNGDKTGECSEETPDGPVYRCLFDIKSETVVAKLREIIVD